jgi:glutaredoxin
LGSAHLVVYGRAYCHLCDDMVAALEAALPALGCTLEVIDVDADPALEARYDEFVPVLTLDGAEICHHFLDPGRLLTALGRTPVPASGLAAEQARRAGF